MQISDEMQQVLQRNDAFLEIQRRIAEFAGEFFDLVDRAIVRRAVRSLRSASQRGMLVAGPIEVRRADFDVGKMPFARLRAGAPEIRFAIFVGQVASWAMSWVVRLLGSGRKEGIDLPGGRGAQVGLRD